MTKRKKLSYLKIFRQIYNKFTERIRITRKLSPNIIIVFGVTPGVVKDANRLCEEITELASKFDKNRKTFWFDYKFEHVAEYRKHWEVWLYYPEVERQSLNDIARIIIREFEKKFPDRCEMISGEWSTRDIHKGAKCLLIMKKKKPST